MFAPSDLFSVRGRTALVTGGATGLGRVCAEALLTAGARVLIASRKAEACEAAAAELSAIGPCEGFGGSVATEAGVAELAAETRRRTGALHILVNNAGMTWGNPFETFPWKAFDRILAVNVTGLFALTRELAPMLFASATAEQPSQRRQFRLGDGDRDAVGDRLFLFGLQGRRPSSDPRARGRVRRAAGDGERDCAGAFPDQHDQVRAQRPKRRGARRKRRADAPARAPEDIAGALLFLTGRGGAYTTGAILPVDGGISVTAPPAMFGDET